MLPDYADVPRWPLTEKYVAGQTHKARRTIERTDDLAGTGWGEQSMREAEIVRYVTDRETYDVADNAARIPMVANTSVGQASSSLRALWNSAAENYPPNIYGTDTLITVKVASISMLGDTTAQVRFTRRLERPGDNPIERNFVATVGFEFRPRVERNLEQVWQNPLGFTVTNYRVDAETLRAREN